LLQSGSAVFRWEIAVRDGEMLTLLLTTVTTALLSTLLLTTELTTARVVENTRLLSGAAEL